MVGQHAVLLLRHAHVVGAQAGLHMRDGDVQLGRGQRARQRGVGVAVDQHGVRFLPEKDLLDLDQHLAGLPAVRAGADAQVVGRARDVQLLEKHGGHVAVVMLPGVDEHLVAEGLQGPRNDRSLDELGPGADDGQDFHLFHLTLTSSRDISSVENCSPSYRTGAPVFWDL